MEVHVVDSEFVHDTELSVDLDHLDIVLHKVSGQELADLKHDRQLKWDETVQDQVKAEEGSEGDTTVRGGILIDIPIFVSVTGAELCVGNRQCSSHEQHQDQIE